MSSFEKRSITADAAQIALSAAIAKAKQMGFAMSVAVCDESGVLKAFIRMDGASDASLRISQDKAYTSASLGTPTHSFWDFVKMKNANNSFAFTIQPCHTFGAPQVEYLVNSLFPNGSALTLWRISNLPNPPTLSKSTVPTAAYSLPPNADQNGGPPPLNTGDVRVQHAIFRGDSVWTAISTVRNWGAGNRASIHWFQIRAAANALIQQGVFGTRDAHYFYPAGCPDNNGNFIMVFSRSGANEFGSIGYTGRKATDPLGTLQASALLKSGVAHYQALDSGGRNRWGDYNGVASDPSMSRVIWIYSEFASAANTWATWVGSAFF